MRIFLTGYMGSGKSTVAKSLAEALSLAYFDTDAYIEQQEGTSISSIFANKGEAYFRQLEEVVLIQLKHKNDVVVSTGGGMACHGYNMERINDLGTSFYIYVKKDTLVERLAAEKDSRPLIANMSGAAELRKFVSDHLQIREPYYFQSKYIIDGGQSISEQVNDIIAFFK
ncbi:MAG: shikimate kinase [Saprospiraceae bacterium]|nr:shikimate kinase [Bacteroidia bacterium]NNL90691.1 shikimate kinase [Saprospiraceae bacterium]